MDGTDTVIYSVYTTVTTLQNLFNNRGFIIVRKPTKPLSSDFTTFPLNIETLCTFNIPF